jgi:hypothetical protein
MALGQHSQVIILQPRQPGVSGYYSVGHGVGTTRLLGTKET